MLFKKIFLIVILLVFVLSLLRLLNRLSLGQKRLAEVKNEVGLIIQEKEKIQSEVEKKQSLDYLEREARDRLNFIRPGERIVILPPPEGNDSGIQDPLVKLELALEDKSSNWQKWWAL